MTEYYGKHLGRVMQKPKTALFELIHHFLKEEPKEFPGRLMDGDLKTGAL